MQVWDADRAGMEKDRPEEVNKGRSHVVWCNWIISALIGVVPHACTMHTGFFLSKALKIKELIAIHFYDFLILSLYF